MRGSSAYRLSVTPGGVLAGPWVRNDLWARARAVPSLDLRFADNKSLVDATTGQNLVTFTRASSGTYVDSQGVIRTATTNEPRFDHNPTTGESLGLLVEESRTNFATQSESFSGWTVAGLTQTTAAVLNPSSSTGVQLFTEDTANSTHRLFVSPTTGQATNSFSVWVKPASGSRLFYIEADNASGIRRAIRFNLQTGVLDSNTGDWSNVFITSFPNGWFRVGGTITDNGGTVLVICGNSSGTSTFYTGDGTSGFYLWGAQLEAGAFPTSYIPTTTAAATRSADVASISGSNFSSWYRQDEGAFYVESSAPSNNTTVLGVGDGTSLNRILLDKGTNASRLIITANSVSQASIQSPYTYGNMLRAAFGFKENNVNLCNNGALAGLDSSVTIPVFDRVYIGANNLGTFLNNGPVKRVVFWPQRLSDSTLQSITQ